MTTQPKDLRAELAEVQGQLRADIDTMQDVYLSTAQRAAFDRIVAAALTEHGGGGEAVAWDVWNSDGSLCAGRVSKASAEAIIGDHRTDAVRMTPLYTTPQPRGEGMVLAQVRDTLTVAANNPVSHGGLRGLQEVMYRCAAMLAAAPGEGSGEFGPITDADLDAARDELPLNQSPTSASDPVYRRRKITPPPASQSDRFPCVREVRCDAPCGGCGEKDASQSAPSEGGGEDLEEVVWFLLGEAPLNNCWFGEKPTGSLGGNYWWRRHLRDAWNRRLATAGQQKEGR